MVPGTPTRSVPRIGPASGRVIEPRLVEPAGEYGAGKRTRGVVLAGDRVRPGVPAVGSAAPGMPAVGERAES